MFYSTQILARKGPLGLVWMAAHMDRGLKRSQVHEASIPDTVEVLMSPDAPLALRLSGHLLLGVCRIYSHKVSYLLKDCQDTLVKIRLAFRPDQLPVLAKAAAAQIADGGATLVLPGVRILECDLLAGDDLVFAASLELAPMMMDDLEATMSMPGTNSKKRRRRDSLAGSQGAAPSVAYSGFQSCSFSLGQLSAPSTSLGGAGVDGLPGMLDEVFDDAGDAFQFDLEEVEIERLRAAPAAEAARVGTAADIAALLPDGEPSEGLMREGPSGEEDMSESPSSGLLGAVSREAESGGGRGRRSSYAARRSTAAAAPAALGGAGGGLEELLPDLGGMDGGGGVAGMDLDLDFALSDEQEDGEGGAATPARSKGGSASAVGGSAGLYDAATAAAATAPTASVGGGDHIATAQAVSGDRAVSRAGVDGGHGHTRTHAVTVTASAASVLAAEASVGQPAGSVADARPAASLGAAAATASVANTGAGGAHDAVDSSGTLATAGSAGAARATAAAPSAATISTKSTTAVGTVADAATVGAGGGDGKAAEVAAAGGASMAAGADAAAAVVPAIQPTASVAGSLAAGAAGDMGQTAGAPATPSTSHMAPTPRRYLTRRSAAAAAAEARAAILAAAPSASGKAPAESAPAASGSIGAAAAGPAASTGTVTTAAAATAAGPTAPTAPTSGSPSQMDVDGAPSGGVADGGAAAAPPSPQRSNAPSERPAQAQGTGNQVVPGCSAQTQGAGPQAVPGASEGRAAAQAAEPQAVPRVATRARAAVGARRVRKATRRPVRVDEEGTAIQTLEFREWLQDRAELLDASRAPGSPRTKRARRTGPDGAFVRRRGTTAGDDDTGPRALLAAAGSAALGDWPLAGPSVAVVALGPHILVPGGRQQPRISAAARNTRTAAAGGEPHEPVAAIAAPLDALFRVAVGQAAPQYVLHMDATAAAPAALHIAPPSPHDDHQSPRPSSQGADRDTDGDHDDGESLAGLLNAWASTAFQQLPMHGQGPAGAGTPSGGSGGAAGPSNAAATAGGGGDGNSTGAPAPTLSGSGRNTSGGGSDGRSGCDGGGGSQQATGTSPAQQQPSYFRPSNSRGRSQLSPVAEEGPADIQDEAAGDVEEGAEEGAPRRVHSSTGGGGWTGVPESAQVEAETKTAEVEAEVAAAGGPPGPPGSTPARSRGSLMMSAGRAASRSWGAPLGGLGLGLAAASPARSSGGDGIGSGSFGGDVGGSGAGASSGGGGASGAGTSGGIGTPVGARTVSLRGPSWELGKENMGGGTSTAGGGGSFNAAASAGMAGTMSGRLGMSGGVAGGVGSVGGSLHSGAAAGGVGPGGSISAAAGAVGWCGTPTRSALTASQLGQHSHPHSQHPPFHRGSLGSAFAAAAAAGTAGLSRFAVAGDKPARVAVSSASEGGIAGRTATNSQVAAGQPYGHVAADANVHSGVGADGDGRGDDGMRMHGLDGGGNNDGNGRMEMETGWGGETPLPSGNEDSRRQRQELSQQQRLQSQAAGSHAEGHMEGDLGSPDVIAADAMEVDDDGAGPENASQQQQQPYPDPTPSPLIGSHLAGGSGSAHGGSMLYHQTQSQRQSQSQQQQQSAAADRGAETPSASAGGPMGQAASGLNLGSMMRPQLRRHWDEPEVEQDAAGGMDGDEMARATPSISRRLAAAAGAVPSPASHAFGAGPSNAAAAATGAGGPATGNLMSTLQAAHTTSASGQGQQHSHSHRPASMTGAGGPSPWSHGPGPMGRVSGGPGITPHLPSSGYATHTSDYTYVGSGGSGGSGSVLLPRTLATFETVARAAVEAVVRDHVDTTQGGYGAGESEGGDGNFINTRGPVLGADGGTGVPGRLFAGGDSHPAGTQLSLGLQLLRERSAAGAGGVGTGFTQPNFGAAEGSQQHERHQQQAHTDTQERCHDHQQQEPGGSSAPGRRVGTEASQDWSSQPPAAGAVLLGQLSQGMRRRDAARCFYDTLVLKNRGFVELYQIPPPHLTATQRAGTIRRTQQQQQEEEAETAAAAQGCSGNAAGALAVATAAAPGPGPSQVAAAGPSVDVWVALTQTGVEVASQRQMPAFVPATQ